VPSVAIHSDLRPRDKAKVEAAVLIVERWILARLRHRRFYSLAELNAAIGALLIMSERRATSSRNARATSSESAAPDACA
jgi:transposase